MSLVGRGLGRNTTRAAVVVAAGLAIGALLSAVEPASYLIQRQAREWLATADVRSFFVARAPRTWVAYPKVRYWVAERRLRYWEVDAVPRVYTASNNRYWRTP